MLNSDNSAIQPVLAHVTKAVALHNFSDSRDWATGLDELAGLTDAEIDHLAVPAVRSDPPDGLTPTELATYCLLRLKGLGRLAAAAELGA